MELDALRLATVGVLLNGGNQPYPTIAGGYVFDSVADEINDLDEGKRRPIVVVRTDEDTVLYSGAVSSGRQARLLIEVSVLSSIADKDGKLIINWPKTDAGMELMLGVLKWQVWNALFGMSEMSQWYRQTMNYVSMIQYNSVPQFATPDRGSVRLAISTMDFLMRLPVTDCVVPPVNERTPPSAPFLPPNLKKVFEYLLAHSVGDYHESLVILQEALTRYGPIPVPRLPAFQRVWATLPDLEIEAGWKIEQSEYPGTSPVTTEPIVVENTTVT
jgi:hypothetical protein